MMNINMTSTSTSASGCFTVSQWQELEHQALIFKYMMAGLPVPSHLMLPIHNTFQNPTTSIMGYCSFYGKKVDPEPGRCRRTDGKKWRCAKDAYPDSKYCERHMHRGRSTRSRKPVESSRTFTHPSSSVMTPLTVSTSRAGNFRNLPLHAFSNHQSTNVVANSSSFNLDSIPFGIPSQDYRYLQGVKPEDGEHSFLSEASRNNSVIQMDTQLDNTWSMMKPSETQNDYHQQHAFLANDFATVEPGRQESHQSLRPFFNEWPNARDSWSSIEDNQSSISTTQLSMASSGLSRTSSQSPHDN